MKIFFSILIFILILGCGIIFTTPGSAIAKESDYRNAIEEKMKHVNTFDGISKEEAIAIAQNDIITNNITDKELSIEKPKVVESQLVAGCWRVIFKARFLVKMKNWLFWYAVDIDKKTGKIKSHGWGPS